MEYVFDKWSRNLKTELITIPLCVGRQYLGTLENPRFEQQAEYEIFIDGNGEIDSNLF